MKKNSKITTNHNKSQQITTKSQQITTNHNKSQHFFDKNECFSLSLYPNLKFLFDSFEPYNFIQSVKKF
jgi:hypothetical protein